MPHLSYEGTPFAPVARRIMACFVALLISLFAMATLAVPSAHAAQGRHVYVVFDDSTSMVGEDGAWCEAQYALECFVAMLGDSDTLTIYPMSAFSGASPSKATTTYKGSDGAQKNVARVHEGDFLKEYEGKSWNADTVFSAAQAAYDAMKSNLGESRLIVLTDGAFMQVGDKTSYGADYKASRYPHCAETTNKDIAQDIETTLHFWAKTGANIYYLALGSGAPADLLPASATGLEVAHCSDNAGIINAVIESCNWAFKRAPLGDYMRGGATTLPMKKVIVFAQGSEASNNAVPGSSSVVDVAYPQLPSGSAGLSTAPTPNKQLVGTISTVNSEFKIGDTTFSDLVSNSAAQVYFEPNAIINVQLVDGDDWDYDTTADTIELNEGSGYRATFTLVDPDTKEPLPLGNWEPSYSAVLEIEGSSPVVIREGESFSVPKGNGHLTASATITDANSGAEVAFTGDAQTVVSDEKTILDWILHFWFILPILLLILLAILAAMIVRKHLNAPRLPEDLYPELYDVYGGSKVATLQVEAMNKNTPFFGAETQCFDLIVKYPFRSLVMPQSIVLRATDKKGNMVIENWEEVIELSKLGERDCVKLGSKKVADCKPEDPPLPLTTASKMKFLGTRSGDEALIELRFKSTGRRKN